MFQPSKTLIFVIICLLVGIWWTVASPSVSEGFSDTLTVQGITSLTTKQQTALLALPLKEVCIKSSFHSAFDGTTMTTAALEKVLRRGCRCLDLEIHPGPGPAAAPLVHHPMAKAPLKLRDACQTVFKTAFQTVPNPGDPLFVHLRIVANNDATQRTVYEQVAQTLDYYWSTALHTDAQGKAVPVTGETPLGDLMGKIVILCDKTQNPTYLEADNYPSCTQNTTTTCSTLANCVNVESGTRILQLRYYNALKLQAFDPPTLDNEHALRTDVTKWYAVIPYISENTGNVDAAYYIKNYGVQLFAAMFYLQDSSLANYENMFNAQQCAFIPLATAIVM